jgi:hypothetical protein
MFAKIKSFFLRKQPGTRPGSADFWYVHNMICTACRQGSVNDLKEWLSKCPVEYWNFYSYFESACFSGHIEVVQYLMTRVPKNCDKKKVYNKGLVKACGPNACYDIVELLLKQNLDDTPDRTIPRIESALMVACEWGHYSIVKLLIEYGAKDLDTALCVACCGNSESHRFVASNILNTIYHKSPGYERVICSLKQAYYNACRAGSLDLMTTLENHVEWVFTNYKHVLNRLVEESTLYVAELKSSEEYLEGSFTVEPRTLESFEIDYVVALYYAFIGGHIGPIPRVRSELIKRNKPINYSPALRELHDEYQTLRDPVSKIVKGSGYIEKMARIILFSKMDKSYNLKTEVNINIITDEDALRELLKIDYVRQFFKEKHAESLINAKLIPHDLIETCLNYVFEDM